MAFPTGWGQYHKITVDASKVAGNLTNFPVPLTDGNFLATVYASTQAAGQDLRFSLDTAGASQLPFEIVSWSTASLLSEVWVRADSLATGANKEFYVWYDNDAASALAVDDAYGRNAVWSEYTGVYHFNEATIDGSAGEIKDAKGTTDGVGVGFPDSVSGVVGKGLDFTTSDYINFGNTAIYGNATNLTVEAWINVDSLQNYGVIVRKYSGTSGFGTSFQTTQDELRFDMATGAISNTYYTTDANVTAAGGWFHASYVFDTSQDVNNRGTFYVSGRTPGKNKDNTNDITVLGSASINLQIGRTSDTSPFNIDGQMDEVRISTKAITQGWAYTNYNAQATTSLFSSPSDPTANGGTVTPQPRGCLTCFTKLWGI